jgi:hypothetical protein
MKAQVLHSEIAFFSRRPVTPLILRSGQVEELTEARVTVNVRCGEREATGQGSVFLCGSWVWKDDHDPPEQKVILLRELTSRISQNLAQMCGGEPAHPLEHGLRLREAVANLNDPAFDEVSPLARALCISPFDAAIHDAAGYASEQSAFRFYDVDVPIPSADKWLDGAACRAIRQLLRADPLKTLPNWVVINHSDDLSKLLPDWVQSQWRCFKIRVSGLDQRADLQRTIELYRRLRELDVDEAWITIDSEAQNPDVQSVVDYLVQLRSRDPGALEWLKYIEQPTRRDFTQHRYDWTSAVAIKPVLLGDGLVSLHQLEQAREQKWSGFALKTCMGHSFALVAAAWARQRKMLIALQDLNNPGFALIHAAFFAAFVPTLNGAELSSPQSIPSANTEWFPRQMGLFQPTKGLHWLPQTPYGLGGSL